MRKSTVAAVLLALGLAGCATASPVAKQAPGSDPDTVPAASSPAPSPSPAAVQRSIPFAAFGRVRNSSGDKATVAVTFGNMLPLSQLNPSQTPSCGDMPSVWQEDPSRSIAIEVTVTAQVTSSLSSPLEVTLDTSDVLAGGGNLAQNGNPTGWAQTTDSTDGGQCDDTGSGGISWSNLAPHTPVNWQGWLVVPQAITPDNPSGMHVADSVIMGLPNVGFGAAGSDSWVPDKAQSHNLVNCPGAGPFPTVLAVSVHTALRKGCTKA